MSRQWRSGLVFLAQMLAQMLATAALLTTAVPGHGGAGIATDGSVGARQTIAGVNAGRHFRSSQTLAITGFQTGAEIFYPSLGLVFRRSALVYALAINFHPTPSSLVGKQEIYTVTGT